jgi:hypothetical protein
MKFIESHGGNLERRQKTEDRRQKEEKRVKGKKLMLLIKRI